MENIYYLLLFCLICWYFIYLRKIAEAARKHAKHYCDQNSLQFIAIARRSSRLTFTKRHGLNWLSLFDIEFSGDGESSNNATLTLYGLALENIEIPPYRVH
ncbi:MAG: DUF3301 domain-containing protein [Colwellia sp.]|nr:DUF3301 domain-containing protein [Colwellia sp.]MCW8865996.1 DUF3301 domain-containing protein [Colwellia sp.]MCW9080770.1 DUF3301 domain-containing protein [Colwellia sp.]